MIKKPDGQAHANERVLIVDDEQSIRLFFEPHLNVPGIRNDRSSIRERSAHSSNRAESRISVILDLGLPDIDGTEVTRLLREWTQIPIIILSVRGSEKDKIAALDLGADDYFNQTICGR